MDEAAACSSAESLTVQLREVESLADFKRFKRSEK